MGESPLQLCREQLQIQYAVKIKSTINHPAKSIIEENWTVHYGKFNENSKPFSEKVKNYFEQYVDSECEAPQLNAIPPWHLKPATVDISLSSKINKKESPLILKDVTADHIDTHYRTHLHIYTDGSKTPDGRTSSAFCVPSLHASLNTRITNNNTIYAAELTAIKLALEWVRDFEITQPVKPQIAILSDSLSTLQSFASEQSKCKPNLFNKTREILNQLVSEVTLVWIPSHVGITGNELADQLANDAIKRDQVELEIKLELKEAYALVEKFIENKWQLSWQNCTDATHYRDIVPRVSGGLKYTERPRAKEVAITRLRLGHYRLNATLCHFDPHNDGL